MTRAQTEIHAVKAAAAATKTDMQSQLQQTLDDAAALQQQLEESEQQRMEMQQTEHASVVDDVEGGLKGMQQEQVRANVKIGKKQQQPMHLEADEAEADEVLAGAQLEEASGENSWFSGKKDELACELAEALGEWTQAADEDVASVARERVVAARAALEAVDSEGVEAEEAVEVCIEAPVVEVGGLVVEGMRLEIVEQVKVQAEVKRLSAELAVANALVAQLQDAVVDDDEGGFKEMQPSEIDEPVKESSEIMDDFASRILQRGSKPNTDKEAAVEEQEAAAEDETEEAVEGLMKAPLEGAEVLAAALAALEQEHTDVQSQLQQALDDGGE